MSLQIANLVESGSKTFKSHLKTFVGRTKLNPFHAQDSGAAFQPKDDSAKNDFHALLSETVQFGGERSSGLTEFSL